MDQRPVADAVWKQCPGIANPALQNPQFVLEHAMRDHCWDCEPWWENVPYCPDDGSKLVPPPSHRYAGTSTTRPYAMQSGYCRKCRHYYRLDGPTGSVLSG